MKVISLAAHKDGVGKTLLIASLAVLAQQDWEAEEGDAGKGKVPAGCHMAVTLGPQSGRVWFTLVGGKRV